MPKNKTEIPKAPLARILFKSGAKRVSADAVDAFADIVADMAEDISKRAVMIAKHSGRKTVKSGDVKLAVK